MKSFFTLLAITMMAFHPGFASVPVSESPTPAPARTMMASEMRIPLGNTGKFISLQDLATIRTADFEQMTGKKMGLMRRMEFNLAQRQLRHSINKDGTVNNKKLAKMAGDYYGNDNSFHFGGFALGFFLGLIGVLIAYLIHDDNHHRRVMWSWIGFGIYIVLLLLLIAAAA